MSCTATAARLSWICWQYVTVALLPYLPAHGNDKCHAGERDACVKAIANTVYAATNLNTMVSAFLWFLRLLSENERGRALHDE